MAELLRVGKSGELTCSVRLEYANRHGLISGATGTGKTVTLQSLAESFALAGVPVLVSDIKGDLSGLAAAGGDNPKVKERLKALNLEEMAARGFSVAFWDVFGERGTPLRATISDLGPLLLGKLLELNPTQQAVLSLVFAVADDNELPILDLKDLRAMLQFTSKHAAELSEHYGNVAPATVAAIQRSILALEEQGADHFFGEPMLEVHDLLSLNNERQGMINILSAEKLFLAPRLYSTVLLWLLSELYENLPEVGDLEKPKLVLFFDEAHILFEETSKVLMEKIELVVRLIRSKGVGVFFVTQNPVDIPEDILSQLGNRVHHALRAFSPKDQRAVRAAAQTLPSNPEIDAEEVIVSLGVGEALVSFLDETGSPQPVERVYIIPPRSHLGPIEDSLQKELVTEGVWEGKYRQGSDAESAYELLKKKTKESSLEEDENNPNEWSSSTGKAPGSKKKLRLGQIVVPSTSKPDSEIDKSHPNSGAAKEASGMFGSLLKSALRTVTNEVSRQVIRGVMGSLLGKKRGR